MEKRPMDINLVTNKWKSYKKSSIPKPTFDPVSIVKPTPLQKLKRKGPQKVQKPPTCNFFKRRCNSYNLKLKIDNSSLNSVFLSRKLRSKDRKLRFPVL